MPLKVLIAGSNSYIGSAFESYVARFNREYEVNMLDVRTDAWRQFDFSGYDCVLHVEEIAGDSAGSASTDAYMRVNRDLAIDVADQAKRHGARQFIFLSSILVYGASSVRIHPNTQPEPESAYGLSKLQAEREIDALSDERFQVAILRLPMVYGKGCNGFYNDLAKLAKKLPFFPAVKNECGALYIENLMEFMRLMVTNRESGVFFPQNNEIVSTADFVREIARAHGRRVHFTHVLDPVIKLLGSGNAVRSAFRSCAYDSTMTYYPEEYRLVDFVDSIAETEKGRS